MWWWKNHTLSYEISNPFQPDFGQPLISYGLLDIFDYHLLIDVGLFVKSAVQMSDAWFEYRYKKKQDGKLYNFELKKYHKKLNTSKQEPYATQTFENQYIL